MMMERARALLVFDYDQDGDLDLFIVNNASGPVLYRNDMDNRQPLAAGQAAWPLLQSRWHRISCDNRFG
jgi:hypothetical protein